MKLSDYLRHAVNPIAVASTSRAQSSKPAQDNASNSLWSDDTRVKKFTSTDKFADFDKFERTSSDESNKTNDVKQTKSLDTLKQTSDEKSKAGTGTTRKEGLFELQNNITVPDTTSNSSMWDRLSRLFSKEKPDVIDNVKHFDADDIQ